MTHGVAVSSAAGGKILLNKATLRLKKGRRYGLCGANGVGKVPCELSRLVFPSLYCSTTACLAMHSTEFRKRYCFADPIAGKGLSADHLRVYFWLQQQPRRLYGCDQH